MTDIPSKNRYVHSLFLWLNAFVGASTINLLGTALPDLICIMDTDLKSASFLFFCNGLGRCITCFLGIFIKDKLDLTLTTVTALVVTSVMFSVVPNSTSLPVTICAVLVIGCCNGVFNIGRFVLMGILWPKTNRGYHFLSSGVAMASLTMPLIASLFVHGQTISHLNLNVTDKDAEDKSNCPTNIHFAFLILSVFTLITASGFITNYFSLMNKGATLDKLSTEENDSKYEAKPVIYSCFIVVLMVMFSTITASMTSVFSLMVTYGLRSNLHLDVQTMSGITSIYSISLLCARIICMFIADRVKPHVILWFSYVFLLCTSIIFILYKDTSVTVLWVVTALRGFGTGPIFSSLVAWTRNHVTLSSRLICTIMALDNIGNLVHPTVTGILMDIYGPNMFIYTAAGTRFLQIVMFGVLNIMTCKMI